jgi:hypothetical protein
VTGAALEGLTACCPYHQKGLKDKIYSGTFVSWKRACVVWVLLLDNSGMKDKTCAMEMGRVQLDVNGRFDHPWNGACSGAEGGGERKRLFSVSQTEVRLSIDPLSLLRTALKASSPGWRRLLEGQRVLLRLS